MAKLGKLSVGGKNETKIMGIINVSPESFFKNAGVDAIFEARSHSRAR